MKLTIEKLAEEYKVNQGELESALEKINTGDVVLYAMSGKMGAGKDTIGDLICEKLIEKGYDVISASYSTPMRQEITDIVEYLRSDRPLAEIAEEYNATIEEIVKLGNLLGEDSIYYRTDAARLAIQYWGTDVRRKQDKNYWINKLVQLTVTAVNENKSVYISDVRFINEVDSIIDLNGKIIRLETPEHIRCERIVKRDGIKPTKEHLTHLSETALDKYEFERVFDGCEHMNTLTRQAITHILQSLANENFKSPITNE